MYYILDTKPIVYDNYWVFYFNVKARCLLVQFANTFAWSRVIGKSHKFRPEMCPKVNTFIGVWENLEIQPFLNGIVSQFGILLSVWEPWIIRDTVFRRLPIFVLVVYLEDLRYFFWGGGNWNTFMLSCIVHWEVGILVPTPHKLVSIITLTLSVKLSLVTYIYPIGHFQPAAYIPCN